MTKEKFFENYLAKRMKQHAMPYIILDEKKESLWKRIFRRKTFPIPKQNTKNQMSNQEQPNEFEVLSPDGFPISMSDTYPTQEAAQKALTEWIPRYKAQGYYSMSDRTRIPYDEIYSYCKIVPLKTY